MASEALSQLAESQHLLFQARGMLRLSEITPPITGTAEEYLMITMITELMAEISEAWERPPLMLTADRTMVRHRLSRAAHCILMCRDTHVPLATECAAERVAEFYRTNIQWEHLQIERGGMMQEDQHMGFTRIVPNAIIVREAETQILASQTAEESAVMLLRPVDCTTVLNITVDDIPPSTDAVLDNTLWL